MTADGNLMLPTDLVRGSFPCPMANNWTLKFVKIQQQNRFLNVADSGQISDVESTNVEACGDRRTLRIFGII